MAVALSCAGLLATPSAPAAQGPEVATDLRPFLIAAIDAPDGRAAGTLAGPLAEVLRSRGISSAPLRVEVTTLRAYREPGCKRLNVHFRQREVKLGDAPPTDRELAFQLNYCRDGQPPRRLE
jgi:hypothetical protein